MCILTRIALYTIAIAVLCAAQILVGKAAAQSTDPCSLPGAGGLDIRVSSTVTSCVAQHDACIALHCCFSQQMLPHAAIHYAPAAVRHALLLSKVADCTGCTILTTICVSCSRSAGQHW
jgi:hypothetical protein